MFLPILMALNPPAYLASSALCAGFFKAVTSAIKVGCARLELNNFVSAMHDTLQHVTHLTLSTGVTRGRIPKGDEIDASKLLASLAQQCPALQELCLDGGAGLDLIWAFSHHCPNLSYFQETVHSLPSGHSKQLQQLFPSFRTQTVKFDREDWSSLVDLVMGTENPTIFDLCGRTLHCGQHMEIGGSSKAITICNGTIGMMHNNDLKASCWDMFRIDGGDLSLDSIRICDMLPSGVPSSDENMYEFESLKAQQSNQKDHVRGWLALHVVAGIVTMRRCKVSGAKNMIICSGFPRCAGPSSAMVFPQCKLVAHNVSVRGIVTGMSLCLDGPGCSADLTNCDFVNYGFIAIMLKHSSQLVAEGVSFKPTPDPKTGKSWDVSLFVTEGSVAKIFRCNFLGDHDNHVNVVGEGSLVSMQSCAWKPHAATVHGGQLVILE